MVAASAAVRARLKTSALVACNVYVSAGGKPGHVGVLQNLLQETQENCANFAGRTDGKPAYRPAAIVHAYADPVYNRSSFHLAGTAENVANLASKLAADAIQTLRGEKATKSDDDDQEAPHPYVGLVDHIAVMPLQGSDDLDKLSKEKIGWNPETFQPSTASGWAARHIGQTLSKLQVHVFYYGSAHPDGTPLATIRRERTHFFQSGGLAPKDVADTTVEVATVGAPLEFVENYNIRMTNDCSKKVAQSLTRFVRERDGGLIGVEALTLPYSDGRWEVACNLLKPNQASADDIQASVEQWQRKAHTEGLVEDCYRVGTTASQCFDVLSLSSMEEQRRYDEKVRQRLQSYLRQPESS